MPTIQVRATPSRLVSDPPPLIPHFYAGCPSSRSPPNLSWLGTGTGICWIAYFSGDSGGGHWLVRMEWRPAGWSMCLPLLIPPCTIKSRSSLLALARPADPGKRAVNGCGVVVWWCGGVVAYPRGLVSDRSYKRKKIIEQQR